jgi:hypothetical protein
VFNFDFVPEGANQGERVRGQGLGLGDPGECLGGGVDRVVNGCAVLVAAFYCDFHLVPLNRRVSSRSMIEAGRVGSFSI